MSTIPLLVNEDTLIEYEEIRVEVKTSWTGDWALYSPRLEPVSAVLATAPSVSHARFVYHFGHVKHTDEPTDFCDVAPLDLAGAFVRIVGRRSEYHDERTLWVGVFTDEIVDLHGSDWFPRGDQQLQAFGLEYLLDRCFITTAQAYNAGASAVQTIKHVPAFNRRREYGPGLLGNRSTSKDGGAFYFHDTDGLVWTAQDVAEAVLTWHGPSDITFALGGQYSMLANIKGVDFLEGLSVRQALNHLIRRERATGWWIPPVASGTVNIDVFSTLGTQLTVGSTTIPANDEQVSIALGTAITPGRVVVQTSERVAYDTVIARGGPIGVCASWAYADGTLEKGWSTTEETDYETGSGESGATAEEHDAERKTDKFIRVFQVHRVPRTWNGECGDGEGGTKRNALLTCADSGSVSGGSASAFHIGGKAFAPYIPLLETAGASNSHPEYRRPLAFCQGGYDSRWYQLDAIPPDNEDLSPAQTRPLNDELAFFVHPRINHILATNQFSGAEDTLYEPQYDYTKLIITGMLALDEHFQVKTTIGSPSAHGKTLIIPVPQAEYWYILQGTVTGVTDGALVKQGATGNVLRNDQAILEAVAALAKAWYGQTRAQLTMSIRQLVDFLVREDTGALYDLQPGTYVLSTSSAEWPQPIGTVVSAKGYDFDAGSVTYQTDYAELDAASLVEFPGLSEPRGVARAIHRLDRELCRLRDHVGSARPRIDPPPGTLAGFWAHIVDAVPTGFSSIPTDAPVYAVKRIRPSNTTGDGDEAVTWELVTGAAAVHWWATNTAEPSNEHRLPNNEDIVVWVTCHHGKETPPLRRLTFCSVVIQDTIWHEAPKTYYETGSILTPGGVMEVIDTQAQAGKRNGYYAFAVDGSGNAIQQGGATVMFGLKTSLISSGTDTTTQGTIGIELFADWVDASFNVNSALGSEPSCTTIQILLSLGGTVDDSIQCPDLDFIESWAAPFAYKIVRPAGKYGIRLRLELTTPGGDNSEFAAEWAGDVNPSKKDIPILWYSADTYVTM